MDSENIDTFRVIIPLTTDRGAYSMLPIPGVEDDRELNQAVCSYRVIDILDGEISVENTVRQGSTFTVKLGREAE